MSVIAAFMMLAATGADVGRYDCAFDKMIAAYRLSDGWSASDQVSTKNKYAFRKVALTLSPDGTVLVDAPAASLNLAGGFAAKLVDKGHYTWSALKPAYCGVVDAICLPTADLHVGRERKAALAIYVTGDVTEGTATSLSTVQFLYSCERTA